MANKWSEKFSFLRGAVARKDRAYVILAKDELAQKRVPHGLCALWDAGEWKEAGVANWLTVGICVLPGAQMLVLGETGKVLLFDTGGGSNEEIRVDGQNTTVLGVLTGVRAIGGKAYAVGMGRQVYLREGPGTWVRIDETARRKDLGEKGVGFNAIDGFTGQELYGAGFKGEIWHYSGKTWASVDSPTNVILADVCCAGDGQVYACGKGGMLLKGRKDSWTIVEQQDTVEDLWSLCWYQEKLYVSTMTAVYTLDGDQLRRIDFGEDYPRTCYQLSTADGVLWSIGPKDVLSFDGQAWTRID